jgi:hypothetical protein
MLLRSVATDKNSNRMSEPFEMVIYIPIAWKLIQPRVIRQTDVVQSS